MLPQSWFRPGTLIQPAAVMVITVIVTGNLKLEERNLKDAAGAALGLASKSQPTPVIGVKEIGLCLVTA